MKKARFWIGIIISIIALAFAFRQVDLKEVWAALAGVNYWLLAASLVPLVLFLVLRAVRWRLLFYPQRGLRLSNLLSVICIGYMLSNIFPARLGDVARAYLLGDTEEISRTAAFSTVVAERVLDALAAVAGFFIILPFAPLPEWMINSGMTVGVVALVAVALFVVLVRRKEWTLRLLDTILCGLHWPDRQAVGRFGERMAERTHLRFLGRLMARLPWVDRAGLSEFAGSLIDGLSGIATLRLGPLLLIESAVIWLVIAGFYWLVLLAFDPGQPFVAAVAVTCVTALGMTIPSSPGFIGVFEFLARETLVLFGMAPGPALSYALVAHAVTYASLTVLGLAGLAQQNVTYSQLQQRISSEAHTPS
ncbi:MAG: flippase-like domain-containing protein [Anaerolineae bacterium]|nr:flippase-like domain-containing protein [Anaerolineae bacterium]